MGKSSLLLSCDVVVVNYNAGLLLAGAVQSALDEGAAHIIVVDNDSHDKSLAHLESTINDERLCIIRNCDNLGFATACNIGLRASTADAVLFLNPDCLLSPGALPCMLDVLKKDLSTGMVGGLLCNPDGSEQAGGRRIFPSPGRAFIQAFKLAGLAKWFPKLGSNIALHEKPLPTIPTTVEAISGACMLVKKEAIADVGLWDEGYFLHCEDLDWCMRFHLRNWRVLFVPDAHVIHVKGACSKRRPFFVEWHKHLGMLRFYKKFFKTKYPRLLWLLVVLGVCMRFILMSIYFAAREPLALLRNSSD